jgi:hypothetical protein
VGFFQDTLLNNIQLWPKFELQQVE